MPAPPPSSTWHLVGGGAVGMALAHRLHGTGEPVRLVTRTPRPDPVELVYHDGDGPPVTWSCPTTSPTADVPASGRSVHRLVIATKAYSVGDVLDVWGPRLVPGARVFFLQNGIGFRRSGDLPEDVHALDAVNTGFAAFRSDERTVTQTGDEPFQIGDAIGRSTPAVDSIVNDLDQLNRAGIEAIWTPVIREHQWLKIAANAVINPLTAIFGCRNGVLLERAETSDLVDSLCVENDRVLESLGFGAAGRGLLERTRHIIRATASNVSSMLTDLNRGDGRSELDFINGALLRAATEHGVEVPVNRSVHDRAAERFAACRSR
ncbi:2-dehydropantoate 2-reductase [bacterium]|nr:2-dehydropantoate 2-reductase [bacterium]